MVFTMESLILLQLSRDEAIVLYKLITRINKSNPPIYENQVEQRLLCDLESLLEQELA